MPSPGTVSVVIDFFAKEKFIGNELWRWAGLFALLLVSLVAGKIASFIFQRQAGKLKSSGQSPILAVFMQSLAGPITLLLLAAAGYLASAFFLMRKVAEQFWVNCCNTLAVLAAGWFAFKLVDVMEYVLLKWTSKTETLLDDQLVPMVRKALRVFVAIVVVLFIAQNIFDWDIASIIAGLGIGGLAVALAAKDTLANLFGSVTIFSDRPFQMGDRIKLAGHDGIVEDVGFRSTRIRTLMGHQIVIPNSIIANEAIENIGRRPYLKRVLEIGVTYDTPPGKLNRAIKIIQQMLDARSENFPADLPPRVFFSEFAASSLTITVYYWFAPPDWWAYMQFNNDLNLELLERFNAEGIDFAFPTQTVHLKQG